MAKKLYEESSIQGIANAIRAKNGSSDTYTVGDMATAIQNIPTGGGDITGNCVVDANHELTRYKIDVTVPSRATNIGSYAFQNCTGLTSIDLPNSITNIGNFAFKNCEGLTSIDLPNSITSIGQYAFQNCAGLTSIDLPNSITDLSSSGVFYGCTGLTSINLPNNVTTLGNSFFSGCTGLTIVIIPSKFKDIGPSVFQNCTGLTSIDLANSITSIGKNAMTGCTSLVSITCRSATPPTIQSNTFTNVPASCAIYVPSESVEAYKTANNWSARADYIQAIPS